MKRALLLLALVLAACGGIVVVDGAPDVDAGTDVDPCASGPGCISTPDGGYR